MSDFYSLSDILSVASVHPFYSDSEYPPTREQLPQLLQVSQAKGEDTRQLKSFPLTRKDSLYVAVFNLNNKRSRKVLN